MIKQIIIGFLIGIASNLAGIYLYIFFFVKHEFGESIRMAIQNGSVGNIIALGALLNLAVFFLLLRKGKIYQARGVVFATILAAIFILISKF